MLKPIWTEGLFLSQHHFQAQDRYHEAQLRDRLAALRRFDWGLLRVEIDDRLLQANELRLRQLHAVWPDGLVVRCGGSSETPPPDPRSFLDLFAPEAEHLDVFAAVAVEQALLPNVAPAGDQDSPRRFERVSRAVHDFEAGGEPQEIELAVPNVRVVFGSEPQQNLSLLPLARLKRGPKGQVVLDESFVPPVLHLAASPFLMASLQQVLGAIASRQRELAGARKQRSATHVDPHAADSRAFWMLHTLNAAIPLLTHLLETPGAHPEEVFVALSGLAGQLCTFAPGADPAVLPRFDYNNLGGAFSALLARITALLSVDSEPSYVEVPLEKRPDGMYTGKLADGRLANLEFFVAVKSSLPEAVLRERVPQILKIAGWRDIYDVVKQARHGIRNEVEWNPSTALPIRPGVCFFRLRREGVYWEEVAKSRSLALYAPLDLEWKDIALQVYAVRPDLVNS
jgi:type VI secretion system protein ImpJ